MQGAMLTFRGLIGPILSKFAESNYHLFASSQEPRRGVTAKGKQLANGQRMSAHEIVLRDLGIPAHIFNKTKSDISGSRTESPRHALLSAKRSAVQDALIQSKLY
eukprot:598469-Amphidinium_carterae.2